jgi:hypothetical protein
MIKELIDWMLDNSEDWDLDLNYGILMLLGSGIFFVVWFLTKDIFPEGAAFALLIVGLIACITGAVETHQGRAFERELAARYSDREIRNRSGYP